MFVHKQQRFARLVLDKYVSYLILTVLYIVLAISGPGVRLR